MPTRCGPTVTIAHSERNTPVNTASRRADRPAGLTFCDLSSFYGPTAGGIRTYHDAKLRWFASQQRHRYVLIHPGRRFAVERIAPSVTVITTYGAPAGAGYRLPVDVQRIRNVVRELQPDILETGDPWFSGPFGLWFQRSGYVRGLVTSFFHGDPMRTYVDPWIARGSMGQPFRRRLGARADRWFYQVQGLYDLTLVSSEGIERALRARGVERVLRAPFGVDPLFLRASRLRGGGSHARIPARGRRIARLLYAGRLQADKGADLLLDVLPRLLERRDVTVTIAGRGPLAPRFAAMRHPRLRVLGFVASRAEMAQLYADHDVLLAPGAHETFGLSGLEALAAGLVVVGANAGGTGELLAQLESPCRFEPGDAEGFLHAIDDAIAGDAADAGRRSREGIALAERYGSWEDAIGRQVDRYCERLCASNHRHRIAVETSSDLPMMQGR
jgi:alpha-1,6-mannosyltransferase